MEVTSLLLELANHGVTGVAAHYEGGGDSGAIEGIVYTTDPCETVDDVVEVIDDVWSAESLANLNAELSKKLEDYLYDILNDVEDWWNNEGGWGTIYIHVPSGEYSINNSIRIVEVETYGHEGNLMNKTKEK